MDAYEERARPSSQKKKTEYLHGEENGVVFGFVPPIPEGGGRGKSRHYFNMYTIN